MPNFDLDSSMDDVLIMIEAKTKSHELVISPNIEEYLQRIVAGRIPSAYWRPFRELFSDQSSQ